MIYNWVAHIKGFLAIFSVSGVGYVLWKHNPVDYLTHTPKDDKVNLKEQSDQPAENLTIQENKISNKQRKEELGWNDLANAAVDSMSELRKGIEKDALKVEEYSQIALKSISRWFDDMMKKAVGDNVRDYENPLSDVKRGEEFIKRFTESNDSLKVFSDICSSEQNNEDCRQITERLQAQAETFK